MCHRTVATAQLLRKWRLPGETFATCVSARRHRGQALTCTAQTHRLSHPVLVFQGVHRHALREVRGEAHFAWDTRGNNGLKLRREIVEWQRLELFADGHIRSRLTKTFSLWMAPHSTREAADELVAFKVKPNKALELLVLSVMVIWLCFLGGFEKKNEVCEINELWLENSVCAVSLSQYHKDMGLKYCNSLG